MKTWDDSVSVEHLKKALRVLHISLAQAENSGYGHMVIDAIREAIHQTHLAINVIEGKV